MEKLKMDVRDTLEVLGNEYKEALKDKDFVNLTKRLDASKEELEKNTSKLQECANELKCCRECKGLYECQNRLAGHVYFPNVYCDKIKFDYVPCKYQKELERDLENRPSAEKQIENARMKDIDITDKNRVAVIKWLKKFYDNYSKSSVLKGLYLHGNFGCGKTYLISALFNELKLNKKATTAIVYFPQILRTLKDDWDFFGTKMDYYQSVDLLLIDDIGAEKVTEWGRDEVLGTILQSRMNNSLPTFFTSNLSIEELEKHLATASNSVDQVKARRIIERIKHLTEDIEMLSENRRK